MSKNIFDLFKKKSENQIKQPNLVLIDEKGTKYSYNKSLVTLGRDPQCDFTVENKYVARINLRFSFNNGKWEIEDTASTNGVWVNGEKIEPSKKIVLSVGDRINVALSFVLYFMEKPEKEVLAEDTITEKKLNELECIMRDISKQSSNMFANPKFGSLIDLFCSTPLYLCATVNENLPKDQRLQVMLFNVDSSAVVPVFTRKYFADAFGNKGNSIKLEPERLLLLLNDLNEHIVINPNSENRLVIPKDVFRNIIFESFSKKYKAKISIDSYKEKGDSLGALICDYNMANDQKIKMFNIITITSYLGERSVWIPMLAQTSQADLEKLLNAKKGDVIQTEDEIHMKPDILQHATGKYYLPVFSTKDEAPQEYANKFSWVNMPFLQCCDLAKRNGEEIDIIINAFTNSLQITRDLINIIKNHSNTATEKNEAEFQPLVTKEELTKAENNPNGGKTFPLDDIRLVFLTVYLDGEKIVKYSIDIEKANDSHYSFKPVAATKLSEILEKNLGQGSFLDNLKFYFRQHNEYDFMKLVNENGIEVEQFHYGDGYYFDE